MFQLTNKKIDSLLKWLYGYHTPQEEANQNSVKQSVQEYSEGMQQKSSKEKSHLESLWIEKLNNISVSAH